MNQQDNISDVIFDNNFKQFEERNERGHHCNCIKITLPNMKKFRLDCVKTAKELKDKVRVKAAGNNQIDIGKFRM